MTRIEPESIPHRASLRNEEENYTDENIHVHPITCNAFSLHLYLLELN